MDATAADQYITYPSDSNLLKAGRKPFGKLIDMLYALNGKEGTKPRTYRWKMDTDLLNYSKMKRKEATDHRKINHKLMEPPKWNTDPLNTLLDILETDVRSFPISYKEQKILWAVTILYNQQKQIYNGNSNICKGRIVNIF